MKTHRLLPVVALIIATSPTLLSAQIIRIGEALWGIHAEFQYWTTVSSLPGEYARYGEFQITKPSWDDPAVGRGRPDPPWDDGDWRIFGRPLQGFEDLAINSKGRCNSGWDNLMELEINAYSFPISDHFKEGDYIRAYGWHVEDWGHSAVDRDHWANDTNGGKTEFHPLIYLQKGDFEAPTFKLFTAQDGSGRFPLASQNLESYFPGWEIPLHPSPFPSDVLPHPQTGDISRTLPVPLLKESAIVDDGVGTFGGPSDSCWATSHSSILATQSPGRVFLAPRLGGFGGCIKPLYFGEFHRTEELLFRDRVKVNVVSLSNGLKAIAGQITATLNNSTSNPAFAETSWTYQETRGGSNIETMIPNPPGNTVSYEFRYSPSEGLWQNEWRLDVLASTRPFNWSPGANRHGTGLGNLEDRVFAQQRLLYYVQPSDIKLTVTDKSSGVTFACKYGYRVTGNVLTPHRDVIATGPLVWQVILERTATGQQVPNPTLVEVRQGSPVEFDYVKVELVGTETVEVTFFNVPVEPPAGAPVLVAGCQPGQQSYRNPAKVRIYANGRTNLGEWMSAGTETLGVETCLRTSEGGDGCQSAQQFLRNLEKIVLVVDKLKKFGLWTGALPPTLPNQVVQTWEPAEGGPGPVYDWYPELPASVKPIVDTYKRLVESQVVAPAEMARFRAAISLVSTLPPVTGVKQPRNGRWETVPYLPGSGKPSVPPKPPIMLSRPSDLENHKVHVVRDLKFAEGDTLTRASILALTDWAAQLRDRTQGIVELTYVGKPGVLSQEQARRRAAAIERVLVGQGLKQERLRIGGVLRPDAGQAGFLEVRIR